MARKTESSFDELFSDNNIGSEDISTLRISEIEPNKNQPRKSFNNETLKQLADSIREHGVLQPLIVRSIASGDYMIIAGERRWRAAKMAGLSEIPVLIRDDLSEEQAMQIAMIENLQRENLNPIEEALGYKELIDKFGMTQDKLAQVLGKARSSVANSLGLLSLPNGVQELLRNGSLSAGHCKALKKVKDAALMTELAHKAAEGELSVRQVEVIAKREASRLEEEKDKKELKPRISYYTEIEVSLSELLGTKVRVAEGKNGNVLQIDFADKEQLEGIMKYFN
ncbi:MAG TPA: stage 0 sporulation protein J [Ruminococcaceae bacterium]|nr:stage 0 sporulation protein J [Oscillospiraceae bacterium]